MADDTNSKIRRVLMSVFGGGEPAVAGDEASVEPAMTQEQLEQRGQALLNIRDSLVSGQLKLLDLETIKEQFGPSWQRKIDHVHMVCETVLKRHLGHRHFYYRASDTAYVIVFDMQDKAAATAACRAIAQEILTRLLGREAANRQITMEINLAEIFPEDVTEGEGFISTVARGLVQAPAERVTSDASQSVISSDAGDQGSLSRQTEPKFVPIHLDKEKGGGVQNIDLQRLLDASERMMGSWQSAMGADRRQDSRAPAVQRAIPIDLRNEGIGTSAAGVDVAGLHFTYSPIWSAPKKAVISYHLNMTMRGGGGRTIEPEEVFNGSEDVKLIRTIDRLVMKRGLADLARAFSANRKYIACIPVTSYSLLDRWGTPTLFDSLLQGLTSPLPQLLVLDVIDAQALERTDLVRCATAAKGKCKYLLLRASLDQTNFAAFAHPMVRAIGGSLRDHAWSEKDAAKKLDAFVTSASAAKLETFIFSILSRSMAFAAIAAGFDYISGPAIAADVEDASGVAPVDMLRLFG
ncbi:MAG TPA: EAL domain-containing protein [Dongiaceae bacterium]|nr:EAL domain-containing protein [Dongiaceae bacterium]